MLLERQDAAERNEMEGKLGEGKRHYGLGLISSCLQQTSETVISLNLLLMNIGKILRDTFLPFWLMLNLDRKSTRLNSSHVAISYAVFCLKNKKKRYYPN